MGGKPVFWGAKNLSVNTWRSGPDICSLICETICRHTLAQLMKEWELNLYICILTLPKNIRHGNKYLCIYIFIVNILIPVVQYKEYYLTTRDSIIIPSIIQKLVDQPFELLKEKQIPWAAPSRKKSLFYLSPLFIKFVPLFQAIFIYMLLHVFWDLD